MAKHACDLRRPSIAPSNSKHGRHVRRTLERHAKEIAAAGKDFHGYYRMYWEEDHEWSATYEEALRVMIHLHDVYALDGLLHPTLYEYSLVLRAASTGRGAELAISGNSGFVALRACGGRRIVAYMDESRARKQRI